MVCATIQNAEVSCPNWLYIWRPIMPEAKQARYTEPVPWTALTTGMSRPIARADTNADLIFGSRTL